MKNKPLHPAPQKKKKKERKKDPVESTANSRGSILPSRLCEWVSMPVQCCGHPADRGVELGMRASEFLRAALIKTAAPFEGIELLTSVTPDKFKPD